MDDVNSDLDDTPAVSVPLRYYSEAEIAEKRRRMNTTRSARTKARQKLTDAKMVLSASTTMLDQQRPPPDFHSKSLSEQIAVAVSSGEPVSTYYADLLCAHGSFITATVANTAAEGKHQQLKGELKGILKANELMRTAASLQAHGQEAAEAAMAFVFGGASALPQQQQ